MLYRKLIPGGLMKIKDMLLIVAATFLVIVGSYIALPIGPVPFALANFFIVLVSLLLGWKRATIAIVLFIVLGAIGLPVFSNGRGGYAHLVGLTGGFIFGYIPLAFITGLTKGKSIIIKIIGAVVGSIVLYLIGVPWAINVFNTVIAPAKDYPLWDLGTALSKVMTPFLIPDLGKIVLAVIISKYLAPVVKPFINRDEE